VIQVASNGWVDEIAQSDIGQRIPDFLFAQFGILGIVELGILGMLFKLAFDFAKHRTEIQQQLMQELLNKRTLAYDSLWSKMRDLALYDHEPLSADKIRDLSANLSGWYFGSDGGLFLSTRTREFYFALQDVLQAVGNLQNWQCATRPIGTKEIFKQFVEELSKESSKKEIAYVLKHLNSPHELDPEAWREFCQYIAQKLKSAASTNEPIKDEVIFAIIQQVSSFLRTNLADGLHSRLEIHAPKP